MTELVRVRKFLLFVEDIFHEGGPPPEKPRRRAAICAVVENPYAGRFEPEIKPMMDALEPLGLNMSKRLVDALGGDSSAIDGYGKGAIVGEAGESEHGALWHVPGGYGMRAVLGGTKAIVPSTKKVGGVGARIDIPIGHIHAAYVRSHFDAMEVGVPDAPRAHEMVLVLVMTIGARIHERVGGLAASEIEGKDGLR